MLDQARTHSFYEHFVSQPLFSGLGSLKLMVHTKILKCAWLFSYFKDFYMFLGFSFYMNLFLYFSFSVLLNLEICSSSLLSGGIRLPPVRQQYP